MNNLIMKISPVILKLGNFEVRWYAICILIGAYLAYACSQWVMKREGYSKTIFESLFFVAFPAGLLGARLWWCLSGIFLQ